MNSKINSIITIDGPSSVGKSNLTRKLIKELEFSLLNSGAIYRLVALMVLQQRINTDAESITKFLTESKIKFKIDYQNSQFYLNTKNVSDQIRLEKTGMMASKIAGIKEVRQKLLQKQRDYGVHTRGLVADGRDMGTVVFPQAQFKFFLNADSEIRAQRRFNELVNNGCNPNFNQVLIKLRQRDFQDYSRAESPLKPATDAYIIDTSYLSANEVFEKVLKLVNFKKKC